MTISIRNRIEKDWLKKIKCLNLTKNLSEKSSELISTKSSMTILYKITIFSSVVTFAREFNFFVRNRNWCLNWYDLNLIYQWYALNRDHRKILNQDYSSKSFALLILNNLLQRNFVHDNWNKRFRQHSFVYDNRWCDDTKQKAKTYTSIEKKIKRISLT